MCSEHAPEHDNLAPKGHSQAGAEDGDAESGTRAGVSYRTGKVFMLVAGYLKVLPKRRGVEIRTSLEHLFQLLNRMMAGLWTRIDVWTVSRDLAEKLV